MARRQPENPTAHTLEEIEHLGDRIVEAVSANPRPVIAVIAAILLIAASWGGISHFRGQRSEAAIAALETARVDFIQAMGGQVGSLEIPEPANPETARSIRGEYAERFAAVAEEHSGTPAASLALIEAGQLRRAMGDLEGALETWRNAAAGAGGPLRALALERTAQALEDEGRFAEAAASYAQAGDISDYPLRYRALGDAARCHAEAAEPEQAVALYKRIQAESPETKLESHVEARLRELEASQR